MAAMAFRKLVVCTGKIATPRIEPGFADCMPGTLTARPPRLLYEKPLILDPKRQHRSKAEVLQGVASLHTGASNDRTSAQKKVILSNFRPLS